MHHAAIIHLYLQVALYAEQDRLRHDLADALTQSTAPDDPRQQHGKQCQPPPVPVVAHRKTRAEQSQYTGNTL